MVNRDITKVIASSFDAIMLCGDDANSLREKLLRENMHEFFKAFFFLAKTGFLTEAQFGHVLFECHTLTQKFPELANKVTSFINAAFSAFCGASLEDVLKESGSYTFSTVGKLTLNPISNIAIVTAANSANISWIEDNLKPSIHEKSTVKVVPVAVVANLDKTLLELTRSGIRFDILIIQDLHVDYLSMVQPIINWLREYQQKVNSGLRVFLLSDRPGIAISPISAVINGLCVGGLLSTDSKEVTNYLLLQLYRFENAALLADKMEIPGLLETSVAEKEKKVKEFLATRKVKKSKKSSAVV